ncbi:MAG: hypothetical protein ABI405_13910, partial [Parafilimonas sp.]
MKYFLFCFCLISVAKAQNYNPDAVNKKAAVTYSKAIEILQNDDIKNAIPVLNNRSTRFFDGFR